MTSGLSQKDGDTHADQGRGWQKPGVTDRIWSCDFIHRMLFKNLLIDQQHQLKVA